ncbi:MAG: hypothetical protein AAF747_06315 [Planctomycetota bacterium]
MVTWRTLGLLVLLGGAVALWRLVPPPADAAEEEVYEPEPDPLAAFRGRGKPPGWDEKIAEVNKLIGGDAAAWERYVTPLGCIAECHLYHDYMWLAEDPLELLPGGTMHNFATDFVALHNDTLEELVWVIRSTPLAPVISPNEFDEYSVAIESGSLGSYVRRELQAGTPVYIYIDNLLQQLAWIHVSHERQHEATSTLLARLARAERFMDSLTTASAEMGTWDVASTLDQLSAIIAVAPGVLGEEELISLQFRLYELDPLAYFQRSLHWDDRAMLYQLQTADHVYGTDASALSAQRGEFVAHGIRESHAPHHALVTNLAIQHLHLPYVEAFDVQDMRWRMNAIGTGSGLVARAIRSLQRTACIAWSCENRRRGAIVGIAAERFRLLTGRHPVDQSELVSRGFLDFEVPGVFGYELVIAPHNVGVMVYDVGPDEVDDGGRDLMDFPTIIDWYRGRLNLPRGDVLLWSTCANWQLHEWHGHGL